MTTSPSLEARFWQEVLKTEGCWEWQGLPNNKGYGHFMCLNKHRYAHRVSWEIHYGDIPKGLHICHKCDNPICVNPEHLFIGTYKTNTQDMIRKGRHYSPFKAKTKLSDDDVRFIRQNYVRRKNVHELAAKFGVHKITIGQIVRGERRRRVVS